MYFPPLVWDNILDYLGIWRIPYSKVMKQLSGMFSPPHNYIAIENIYYPKGGGQSESCHYASSLDWWWQHSRAHAVPPIPDNWSYTIRIVKQRYRYAVPFKNRVKVLTISDYIAADYVTRDQYWYYD